MAGTRTTAINKPSGPLKDGPHARALLDEIKRDADKTTAQNRL